LGLSPRTVTGSNIGSLFNDDRTQASNRGVVSHP
jgi:hypothetical protein